MIDEKNEDIIKNERTYLTEETVESFKMKGAKIIFLFMPNSSSSRIQEEGLDTAFDIYHDKISFGSLNVLESQEFAIKNRIRQFPATLYYKAGNLEKVTYGVDRDIENSIMLIL